MLRYDKYAGVMMNSREIRYQQYSDDGLRYKIVGDYGQAILSFKNALRMQRQNYLPYHEIAVIYDDYLGELRIALSWYIKAVSLMKENNIEIDDHLSKRIKAIKRDIKTLDLAIAEYEKIHFNSNDGKANTETEDFADYDGNVSPGSDEPIFTEKTTQPAITYTSTKNIYKELEITMPTIIANQTTIINDKFNRSSAKDKSIHISTNLFTKHSGSKNSKNTASEIDIPSSPKLGYTRI